jgi:hypothetical protein
MERVMKETLEGRETYSAAKGIQSPSDALPNKHVDQSKEESLDPAWCSGQPRQLFHEYWALVDASKERRLHMEG